MFNKIELHYLLDFILQQNSGKIDFQKVLNFIYIIKVD